MKVGLDGRYLSLRRGMGNLLHGLVDALGREPRGPELSVYVPDGTVVMPDPGNGPVRMTPLPPAPYPLWEQILVPWAAMRDRVDLLHSPGNSGPLRVPRGVAQVVTVHDAMFMLEAAGRSPSVYQRAGRRYRRTVVPRVARQSAAVITDSDHSSTDIQRLVGVPPDRVRVIRPAAGAEFRMMDGGEARHIVDARLPDQAPYVFALGAVDPRKNTARVLRAFARTRAGGLRDHRLLVVGLDHGAEVPLGRLAHELQIASSVTMLDFVTMDELAAFYNAAEMFVYPSLYEGFGLPVLEAMACGTPVITSRTTCIPEITGSAAVLVDPTDVDAIAGAMLTVAGDNSTRRCLRERGLRQAATFSWERAAKATIEVYQAALERVGR